MRKCQWLMISLMLVLLAGCGYQAQAKIQAVASFSIIADLVAQVGGDKVEVKSIIPFGGDPHHWEATSREAISIAKADILFYNGLGLETWIEKLVDSAGTSSLRKVVLSQGLIPLPGVSHDHHDHQGGDPHFWHDVDHVKHYVKIISRELTELDPGNQEYYERRAQAYLEELTKLDNWLVEQISMIPVENRKFISYHASFNYLAHRYGLEVIGHIVTNPDSEPSARDLGVLASVLNKHNRKVIFIEPQAANQLRLAEVLASEVGGKVYTLYSDSLLSEAPTYLDMMYHNGKTLLEALK